MQALLTSRVMRTAGKLCTFTVAALMLGCQRGPAPLSPVSGKVAFKGVILPSGTIVFTPDTSRGASGPIAFGKIKQDGSYQLYTGEAPGAAAGWYRVTVTSLAPSSAPAPGQPFNTLVSYLPDKYRNPELSQLACEIKSNRPNAIDFNLD